MIQRISLNFKRKFKFKQKKINTYLMMFRIQKKINPLLMMYRIIFNLMNQGMKKNRIKNKKRLRTNFQNLIKIFIKNMNKKLIKKFKKILKNNFSFWVNHLYREVVILLIVFNQMKNRIKIFINKKLSKKLNHIVFNQIIIIKKL